MNLPLTSEYTPYAKDSRGILVNPTEKRTRKASKSVSFSVEPPTVHKYECEYGQESTPISFFDEGWKGRAQEAMNTTGFIDFKSKIEAKLSAINNPMLMSQLDAQSTQNTRYRNKSRLVVEPLALCPESSESEEDTMSPNNDSPLVTTPSDTIDSWLSSHINTQTKNLTMYTPVIN